jgi:hypothetical protein
MPQAAASDSPRRFRCVGILERFLVGVISSLPPSPYPVDLLDLINPVMAMVV